MQAIANVAANDNLQTRQVLYQAFVSGHLWTPIGQPLPNVESGSAIEGQDVQIQIPSLQDPQGNKLLAVFTDAEALSHFAPNMPYIAVPGFEFFRMAASTDVVAVLVNPTPPNAEPIRPGGNLLRHEFEALAQGRMPQIGQQPQQEQAQQPAQNNQANIGPAASPLPDAALEELRKAAKYEPIAAIYHLQMQMPPNAPSRALAFELTHTPPQTVIKDMFEAIAERIRQHMPQGEPVQFITVEGEGAQQCKQAGETLYVKE
jgi:hypothetical protein